MRQAMRYGSAVLFAMLVGGCGPQPSANDVNVSRSALTSFQTTQATGATYVDEANAKKANGGSTALYVRNNSPRRALVRADLSSVPGAAQCAVLDSASVSLVAPKGTPSGRTYAAHRIVQAWNETAATWVKRDTANPWSTAGGSYAATASAVTATGATSMSWDVTADVSAMLAGALPNFGWLIKDTDESGTAVQSAFNSDDTTSGYATVVVQTHSACADTTCEDIGGVVYETTSSCVNGACVSTQQACDCNVCYPGVGCGGCGGS